MNFQILKLIFKGKYQQIGRGIRQSLYFPNLTKCDISIMRACNGRISILTYYNDSMPLRYVTGLYGAVVLVSKYLWGRGKAVK